MNKSEIYDKIIWIYKIPEIILENIVSREKLKNFPSHVKEGLVFKILETLSQYFSVVPDYYYDKNSDSYENIEDMDGINATLTIWLSGLSDLSVCQIIGGLLDILNMKTEYQKWPPKSVMQFYTVCTAFKPAYHDAFVPKINENKKQRQIGFVTDDSEESKEKKHVQTMVYTWKILGSDYKKKLISRIEKLKNKEVKTIAEDNIYKASKSHLNIILKMEEEKS
ncbi:MAG: hypothetical protein KBG30_11825 [Bacteroidales bacterium]|jgi:hypothetical protein|nr:hypothetical protein [Bacteroidales bacterium]